MSNTFGEKVLAFTKIANELFRRQQLAQEERAAKSAAVSSKIPVVVDALVKHERIFEHQKSAVAAALSDPLASLDLLRDLAAHRNSAEQVIGTPMGQPKSTKSASAVCGAPVSNYDDLESGRRFRELLSGGRR